MVRRQRIAWGVALVSMSTLWFPAAAAPNTTTRVGASGTGEQASGGSWNPAVTPDGRFVVFHSFANNLVPGDTPTDGGANRAYDVFVHDRQTGVNEMVSLSSPDGDLPPLQGDDNSTR